MMLLLRIILVYGFFMIGAMGPALFDNPAVATMWMVFWMLATFGAAAWSRTWQF